MLRHILQWNCRGLRTACLDLQAVVGQHRPAAICLCETKLAPTTAFNIKGYSVFRKDLASSTIAHGGVTLAVHHSLPSQRVALSTSLQAVAGRVQFHRRIFTICSVYLPPDVPFPRDELTQLIAELPRPFVVLGDFNAHHVAWGCESTNCRGQALERLVNDDSLCILNTGTRTHITLPSGSTSAIDLSISSPELAHLFSWSVSDDPLGSDHFPVWLEYQECAVLGPRPKRWNLRKADWGHFESRLEVLFPADASEGTDVSVDSFTESLVNVAKESIPRTSGLPRRAPVPWWTNGCFDAIRARKRALRVFRRHCTTENLISFRKARALARRTIREAKRRSWHEYVSRLNRFTPLTQVWSQIRRISGQSVSTPLPVLQINGRDVLDPAEVADEIGKALSDRSRGGCVDPRFLRRKANCEAQPIDFSTNETLSYNQPFSMFELEAGLISLRNVAEGPDRVHNVMLQHLPRNAKEVLLHVFNKLWINGQFPSAWRDSVVIPILKPGKSGTDPVHYRPISLTSSLCKLMERLVNARLSWFLESSNFFANAQCGFRKNRSTIDHLLKLDSEVRIAFQQRRHVGAVFFDIEGAYDVAWRHGILLKVHQQGIRGPMGMFLQNFLSDRFFTVRVGNQLSNRFQQFNGVPQGGVLSVALFAIAINDIVDVVPRHISCSLFVDDFAIWLASCNYRSIQRQLQLAVKRLEEWSIWNGFRFSTAKTVAVHFCRLRRSCPDMTLRLYNQLIASQSVVRFLGLNIDKKLTYAWHVRDLRERCSKAMNVLKCVSRMSYGADRKTLLLLYRSLVRSKLDYACFVYESAAKSVKRPLDTIHHAAMRVVTGAFRTTPVASLLVETNEPPLALRRAMLGMRYTTRILSFPDHPTYPYVCSKKLVRLLRGRRQSSAVPFCVRMRKLLEESSIRPRDIRRFECLRIPPWELAEPLLDTTLTRHKKNDTPPEVFRSASLELIAGYATNEWVRVYTDGSKTSSGVGCAFVLGDTTRTFTLPSSCSVFTAELVAILKALCLIEVSEHRKSIIVSDSLSSIQSIAAYNPENALVQDILLKLTSLREGGKKVVFCWIPSHVGVRGNEQADEAAKRATQADRRRRFPVPAGDLRQCISSLIRDKWQDIWNENPSNKLKRLKPRLGDWQSSSRKSRWEEVALFRLRVGHTLATHRYLLCREEKPKCENCDSELSVRHVLESCPGYVDERRHFLGQGDRGLSLCEILNDESPHIDSVLKFVREIGFKVVFKPG